MPHTTHYAYLVKRIDKLRKALIPKAFSPTGNYKNSTYEKVLGYKLLIHAEIEYYFEELTKSIMLIAKRKWDSTGEATKTIIALVAYCKKEFPSLPEHQNDQHAQTDLKERINTAYTEQYRYIQAMNHGIKEKNIIALLLPIGVAIDSIDNNLLIALNNFGAERGRIAHATRAQQCPTPEDAVNETTQLLALIDAFDSKMLIEYQL